MTSATRSLRVTCDTKVTVPLDELHGIQGNLKGMSIEAYEKFRTLILRDGINFAMHVWKELDGTKKKGVVKYWVIDGHGRLALLRKLRDEEGYQVPEIPVVEIEAVSYQDAKRKVLAASSSFHRVSKDGLYEFMTEAGLTMEDLAAYDLAEIDLPAFGAEYFDVDPDIQPPETHEEKEKYTFTIKCETLDQLNDVQDLFGVTNQQGSYSKFRLLVAED